MDIGTWWIWSVVGLALFGLEVIVPGTFFFLFFGAGAFITGIVQLFFNISSEWAWGLFSVLSIVSLILFRARLLAKGKTSGYSNSVVGMTGKTLESIPVHADGKVEISGSSWSAKNEGEAPLIHGAKVIVLTQNGLKLTVKGA